MQGVKVTSVVCDLLQPEEITKMLDGSVFDRSAAYPGQLRRYRLVRPATQRRRHRLAAVDGDQSVGADPDHDPSDQQARAAPRKPTSSTCRASSDWCRYAQLATYQASKYGLVGFTLAIRNDYHRNNFGVSVICPGLVKTPMVEPDGPSRIYSKLPKIPASLYTTPERVAEATVDAIKRDRGLVLVTLLAHVLWRLNRFFPGLVDILNREGWRSRGPIIPPGGT